MITNNLSIILPVVVGGGVLVLILMIFRSRRVGVEISPMKFSHESQLDNNDLVENRRNSLRRDGAPVKIDITSSAFKNNLNGYVVDRSTGGLRVAMKSGLAPGSSIQVRACHAPDTIPWVTVIVRSCKDVGKNYELGCEFEKTPPWNVLLLFG